LHLVEAEESVEPGAAFSAFSGVLFVGVAVAVEPELLHDLLL